MISEGEKIMKNLMMALLALVVGSAAADEFKTAYDAQMKVARAGGPHTRPEQMLKDMPGVLYVEKWMPFV